jgi:predicted ATPase/DNA-binding SARP family transcriptional activator
MEKPSDEARGPPLVLGLLGPPLLTRSEDPVLPARRKSIALLAYLALERSLHLRDGLAALLWPECGQANARANLRQCLFDLARAAGRDLVARVKDGIRLLDDSVALDVDAFLRLSASCPRHAGDTACPECAGRLEAACRLWRGDFMAGFAIADSSDFDQWQLGWAERLGEAYRDALGRLLRHHAAMGCLARAEEFACLSIRADPYDEEARRRRIELLLRSDRPGRALDCYLDWAETARNELGQEPDASTTALVEHLLAGPAAAKGGRVEARRGERSGLPAGSRLVGRERELDGLRAALCGSAAAIHTIVGPGGIGKTRLARAAVSEIGDRFPGGAFFVDLSPLRDPGLVPPALSTAMGLGEASRDGGKAEDLIAAAVGGKRTLVVLDNFEQVLPARDVVRRLRDECPSLVIAVTSREALGVAGEIAHELDPLGMPPEEGPLLPSDRERYPALELLALRAAEASPGFVLSEDNVRACASLCARLDGIPLALELAASRLASLEPAELLERIAARLDLIGKERGNGPARHRTLRAVIDWSYGLLSPEERSLFARLGAFRGGFDVEAIEAIAGLGAAGSLETVSSLAAKSLLRRAAERGSTRFSLLESVEEYARERLEERADAEEILDRHGRHFLGLAERRAPELRRAGRDLARFRLDADSANFAAALERFIGAGEVDHAYRLCLALEWHWFMGGRYAWSERSLRAALGLGAGGGSASLRGACRRALGWVRFVQGAWREALAIFLEAERELRASGNAAGLARCLSDLGVAERFLGDLDAGNARCLEAVTLAREIGDPEGLCLALVWAFATTGGRRVDEAQYAGLEEAVRLAGETGDAWAEAHALDGLGEFLREKGRPSDALPCFEGALRAFEDTGDDFMRAWTLEGLGLTLCVMGDRLEAASRLRGAVGLFAKIGDRGGAVYTLGELGLDVGLRGDVRTADFLLAAADALSERLADAHSPRAYANRRIGPSSGPAAARSSSEAMLERATDEARSRSSPEWRRGRLAPYAEAVAFALEAR